MFDGKMVSEESLRKERFSRAISAVIANHHGLNRAQLRGQKPMPGVTRTGPKQGLV
jgi:hypothetical protein